MKVNQLKAGVALSYISIAINSVIQLAYTPVMLRLLGQNEYGLYTLTASVISYLGLLSFGIGGAYLRFYSRERAKQDEEAVAKLNGMFLLVYFVIGLLTLVGGIILSNNASLVFGDKLTSDEISSARVLLILMAINMAISLPNSVFTSYISACEQYVFQRVLHIASSVLNPFLALPLMLMGYGSLSLVSVSLLLTVATAVCNIWFCFRKINMHICFRRLHWGMLKDIYVFSFFVFLNQVIDQINWNVDSYLLGRFWGTATVAVYGLAGRINSLYLSFSTAVSSVFAPRINRIVAEAENPDWDLLRLMIKVGRIQAMILGLLLMGLITLGKPFLRWMGKSDAYLGSYPVMLLLIIPVTIPLVQNIGIEIQRAKNKHQFRSVIYAGMAVINVMASIPLSRRYGATGAAFGTTVSLLLGNGLIMNWYYHTHLGLNMKSFWKGILPLSKAWALPIIYCVICMAFTDCFCLLTFFAVGTGLVLLYCAAMWHWGMNPEERQLVMEPIRRILRKNDSND